MKEKGRKNALRAQVRKRNGVTGRSDIEGKATRVTAMELGQRRSFKEKLIRNPGKQEGDYRDRW
jgi:hypothetical protein